MPDLVEPVPPLPQFLHIPLSATANRKAPAELREVPSPLSMADAMAARETMKGVGGADGEGVYYNLEIPPANIDQKLLSLIDKVIASQHILMSEDQVYQMGTALGKAHAKSLEYISRDAKGMTRKRNISSSGSKLECHRRILTWHYCLFRQQHGWSKEQRRIEALKKPVEKPKPVPDPPKEEEDEEEEEEVEENGEEEEDEEEAELQREDEHEDDEEEEEEEEEKPKTSKKTATSRIPTPVATARKPTSLLLPTPAECSESVPNNNSTSNHKNRATPAVCSESANNNASAPVECGESTNHHHPAPAECGESANNVSPVVAATVTHDTAMTAVDADGDVGNVEGVAKRNLTTDDENVNTTATGVNKKRRLSAAASRLAFDTSADEILSLLGELDPETTNKIQSLESIFQMRRSAVADGIQSLEQLYKMRRTTFDEIDRLEDVIEDEGTPESKRERCQKRKAVEALSLENINQQIVKLEQRTTL